MSRVVRKQANRDQELAELGQRRVYTCELVETATGLMPIYRERVIANDAYHTDRTPWWKRQRPKARRAKTKSQ